MCDTSARMEDETEDRGVQLDAVGNNQINKQHRLGQDCHDIEIEGNMFLSSKQDDSLNLSNDGQDSGSSRSDAVLDVKLTEEDLMSESQFGENSALIKDIRLAASMAAEEEVNKVYMCHLCDFKTAYANSLMNHQAVHSDFRPWACTACEYAAKRKQDLKKHLHTVHGMMVESPMLKPLVVSGGLGGNKFGGNAEGMKEQFIESLNLKRPSPSDQDGSLSQSQPTSSSSKRMREEVSVKLLLSSLSSDETFSTPTNVIPGMDFDSPDDNLPISFPSSSSSAKRSTNSESPPLPRFLPGHEDGELVLNGAHPTFSTWRANRREKVSDSSASCNIPRDWTGGSPIVKKEIITHDDAFTKDITSHEHNAHAKSFQASGKRDNSLQHSCSVSDEEAAVSEDRHGWTCLSETDKSISSSSLAGHRRSTQTPPGFLCEHCDILFFQRAMYVMHIGLHAPDNPWSCSVCGHTFSEKYSFTSHFINQH